MHILKDLLEIALKENAVIDARFEKLKVALEEKELELNNMIDEMRNSVEGGEFEAARQTARKFEDLCHKTNELSNKLADI